MVVAARVQYLLQCAAAGRAVSLHFSPGSEKFAQKIRVVVGPVAAGSGCAPSPCVQSALRILVAAAEDMVVVDRGHRYSNGHSECSFYIKGRRTLDPNAAAFMPARAAVAQPAGQQLEHKEFEEAALPQSDVPGAAQVSEGGEPSLVVAPQRDEVASLLVGGEDRGDGGGGGGGAGAPSLNDVECGGAPAATRALTEQEQRSAITQRLCHALNEKVAVVRGLRRQHLVALLEESYPAHIVNDVLDGLISKGDIIEGEGILLLL